MCVLASVDGLHCSRLGSADIPLFCAPKLRNGIGSQLTLVLDGTAMGTLSRRDVSGGCIDGNDRAAGVTRKGWRAQSPLFFSALLVEKWRKQQDQQSQRHLRA